MNAYMIHRYEYTCQNYSLVNFVSPWSIIETFYIILFDNDGWTKKSGHNFWHGYSYESYEYPCQKSCPWIFTFSIWIYNENHCHLLILVKWKEPGNHFYQGYSYHHMSIHAKNHFPGSFNLVRINKIIVCNAEFIQWLWTNKKSLGPDFLLLDIHMGYMSVHYKSYPLILFVWPESTTVSILTLIFTL